MNIQFCFLFLLLAFSQTVSAQYKLEMEVSNMRSNEGKIMMQLFDESHNVVKSSKGYIKNNKCNIIFENLKPAKYAVQYFHDENSNNKIDKNFIGIPTEGYGFSNNAYGTFGPEAFEKWLFDMKGNSKISMKIKY